ncbi:lipase [Lithospermum erythrorhizon]|uniref:Lipase n=1 Tax=Lithospermum erythrorhizon TaxID=34254 RepID=A0AAV3PWA6_LITER
MRTLFPNLDREDGLDTVLEVPIPEEMLSSTKQKSWRKWMKSYPDRSFASHFGDKSTEIQLLLTVLGAPLIPLPVNHDNDPLFNSNFKGQPIEASMAKYIVQQYIAAAGGDHALSAIESMYAMGKVKMATTEVISGDGKVMKMKSGRHSSHGEMGGFVLWQKRPDLWSLELVVSACKISAGCDGKVAWRQTPWNHSQATRGPSRPLRRCLQGLDPRSTANLFANSICIGEKTINDEDCFVLKLVADSSVLKARSSINMEMVKHTIFGYFSQRTGLLVQLEDTHLLRISSPGKDDVFWETTMETQIQDYRTIDGVNIAHGGRTVVSLFRYGENGEGHTRTRMEEVWTIEEVDFNIAGLSLDCFLPPADVKKDEELCGEVVSFKVQPNNPSKVKAAKKVSKVTAIDEDVLEPVYEDDEW